MLENKTANDATQSAAPGRSRRRLTVFTGRPAQRAATTASVIYRDLRDEIAAASARGTDLRKQIAEAYGISRTPVREAVLRLADEGLIEVFPQSGTFVSRIPLAALPEAIAVRRVLEEAVMRHAAAKVTRVQLAELYAGLERQRETAVVADQDRFHQCDKEFHALLARIAGYVPPSGRSSCSRILQVDRFCRLTLPVAAGWTWSSASTRPSFEARIGDHDPDRAARAPAHLDDLETAIATARHEHPQYFQAVDPVAL